MNARPSRLKESAEDVLSWQLRAAGFTHERQYKFHPDRRWRFDIAFPVIRLAVEVEGLVFLGKGKNTRLAGRHVSPSGFERDCEKYAEAAILGWRLIRITQGMVLRGVALDYVERAITEGGR